MTEENKSSPVQGDWSEEVSIPSIIALKRDGKELTKQQIVKFIHGVVSKEVQDSQLGKFKSFTPP